MIRRPHRATTPEICIKPIILPPTTIDVCHFLIPSDGTACTAIARLDQRRLIEGKGLRESIESFLRNSQEFRKCTIPADISHDTQYAAVVRPQIDPSLFAIAHDRNKV